MLAQEKKHTFKNWKIPLNKSLNWSYVLMVLNDLNKSTLLLSDFAGSYNHRDIQSKNWISRMVLCLQSYVCTVTSGLMSVQLTEYLQGKYVCLR